ncbi:5-formyltetrahydrofolate cyclo-ligase [Protaetiibacter mangrovi]|uniref:5-formyltetrahydrofolate cyclo-ligase n=1 Tax=Protaetiibacter mangrovi TaxID=2970926 RepID=A0ABT1ZDS2_9MICO|nr:5-formyltetrahydrofolate cyclo-ligase [Protaetiibacter mangrovi]MCS0498847.1 5-formyltetrahydrofolate cyclo-ligase [Protaetiibacter mangrovi]TPX00656.1 5-formyltetrahydrofolate cyclo-ligase [Schumannella luteola]
MADEPENRKRALRAELRERRRIRTAPERERAQTGITQHLVQLASDLDVGFIAAYLSTPDEPGTRDFLRWAAERGIRILLPISREDGLLDWAPYDGEDEEQDILGMPTPTSELLGPIAINGVDLILVPAACVAKDGMRLGWGRGYFDKTLGSMEGCPPVYAVIYDDELVDEVPAERHDMPVDGVVTPAGIVSFAAA